MIEVFKERSFKSVPCDYHQPVSVESEYEMLRPGHELQVHFYVVNQEGINAFMPIENDPTWRKKPRQSGRYVSTAWIPGDLLSEGMHFIQPRVPTLNPLVRRVVVSDAVAIHITGSMDGNGARADSVDHMHGVVRPLLKWETQFSLQ